MKLWIYIIVCSTILLFSCKRSGSGYVDGHVYEAGTNTPISGAKITLSYYHTSEAVVNQTKTDANGYFKIRYSKTALPGYRYWVNARADYYYIANDKRDISYKKENLEYYFSPIAYTKFHIINLTPVNYTLAISNSVFNTPTIITGNAYENKTAPNYLQAVGNTINTIKWNYLDSSYSGNVPVNVKHDTIVYTITLN
ncbi:MAG: carboxypeptidase-like regulatory domain-containing protein [Bacteroidota bacterium]